MICSSGVRLQTELDSSQSYYQLIKTIVQREKLDVTYTFLLQKQQLTEQNGRIPRCGVLSTYSGITCQLCYYTVQLQA